ncbi:poly adp-ribose glycohydrolase [Anaeramoeba flamelloides]|uniref:Poly adp-ribose glycohydrolase n=1 Tax=Anaeramoeba flamelloides TaxID=1746091 RepID=A0ABQ8XE56_9EUKA|nr:poly adp-ribose glycohydrolase [Anaeramoeba flamelloides]
MDKTIKKNLLSYLHFSSDELYQFFPPIFYCQNKKWVAKQILEKEIKNKEELIFSKWSLLSLPKTCELTEVEIEMREDIFEYEPPQENETAWYPNYAAKELFGYYSGSLLAQDELQVLEHPVLGSLRDCLTEVSKTVDNSEPTTGQGSQSTPVLIMNAERRCHLSVEPNVKEGRPQGIYGNRFARASKEVVKRALTILDPPTFSNIYAIEAPKYGSGNYTLSQIYNLFGQCYTVYTAAKIQSTMPKLKNNSQIRFNDKEDFNFLDKEETIELNPREQTVTIHLGHWGSGAYGGNKVMITIIQLLASYTAGVDKIVYHTFDHIGTRAFKIGLKKFQNLIEKHAEENKISISSFMFAIENLKLKWGHSDGN